MTYAIRHTPELTRILALPRRSLTEAESEALAAELTSILRTPNGTQALRTVQALALHDIASVGGGFLPIGVGEGKTLIALLSAFVLDAKRPLLLLPANLIEQANRERRLTYSPHWLVPKTIRFFSYDMLGRAQSALELETYKPDLIICDEVHRLKNKRAAVTRRVSRYMHDHPETMFVGMSGTIMRKSLHDFAHILRWALKDGAPIPKTEHELEEWATALDEPSNVADELERPDPGALVALVPTDVWRQGGGDIADVRRGFRARLVETPGVVATAGKSERVDCSIYLRVHITKAAPVTEQHFRTLRSKWETPCGLALSQGVDVWRHARELALGFHYRWDPPAPEEWLNARREWAAFVREVLSRSRTLDSELQVVNAVDAGTMPDGAAARGALLLGDWRRIRDTFRPNTVAVWHDTGVIEQCAAWAKTPGIVWTEHTLFAERLSKETGLPYFGESGYSAEGVYIADADPRSALIASTRANKDGKNLQKWFRNLVVSPPEGWDTWQQMIGRTHRPGQMSDAVEIDVLWGCREHIAAWHKALAGTQAARDTVGSDEAVPKLLLALPDADVPDDETVSRLVGARWAA